MSVRIFDQKSKSSPATQTLRRDLQATMQDLVTAVVTHIPGLAGTTYLDQAARNTVNNAASLNALWNKASTDAGLTLPPENQVVDVVSFKL